MRQREWMCIEVDGASYVEFTAYKHAQSLVNQREFERDQAKAETVKLKEQMKSMEEEATKAKLRLQNLDSLYAEIESLRNQNKQLKKDLHYLKEQDGKPYKEE